MRSIGNRILGGVLAAWLLALVSCGTVPTAPQVDSNGATDGGATSQVMAEDRGASREGAVGVLGDDDDGRGAPINNPPNSNGAGGAQVVEPVYGYSGATIHVADVTVKIPPAAFQGTAQIKITVPDSTKLECHLEIFPASKNSFAVPVRLEFNVRAAGDPRVMVVYWFDEAVQAWVPLTTSMDAATGKVWTELSHFSIYKADSEVMGRAGW